GLSQGGSITKNAILFSQTFFQMNPTNGGGIEVTGEPALAGTLSLGTGNLTIDSNLIRGNFAEGKGGGIRLEQVNGADVALYPNIRPRWHAVTIINNMIANNVAGWSGGGISLADTLVSTVVNNTVVNNDSTSVAGPLLLAGAVIAVSPSDGGAAPIKGNPMPAGISTEPNTPALTAAISLPTLPAPYSKAISNPNLENNIGWKNRSFFFNMTTGTAKLCASNVFNDASCNTLTYSPYGNNDPAQRATTGQAATNEAYWEIGVEGDASAAAPGTNRLQPTYSVLSAAGGGTAYPGNGNLTSDPNLTSTYSNGSRAGPGLNGGL